MNGYEQHISNVGKKFVHDSIVGLFPDAWPREVGKVLNGEGLGTEEHEIVLVLFKLGILDTEVVYDKGYRICLSKDTDLKQMPNSQLANLVEEAAGKIKVASTVNEHKVFLEAARRLHEAALREAALLAQGQGPRYGAPK